ncbi:VWA domain-containing protein [uncultured Erythrobacter sp.]|uniref:vWA domain-containing protein n=1 Tax=uncultured Erythrobacter sp. TaxID=263913 RepID=UPI0026194596|nr:VWA domain-containing protein [uncultured Erythrobacter sp.]
MKFSATSRRALMLSACLSLAAPMSFGPAFAQDAAPPEDDEIYVDSQTVIVTATRATPGGAQDVKHFRSIALDEFSEDGLPRASSFTVEGLLSEHDLILPSKGGCEQLFCVSTHAMPASRTDDEHFVGIGFESGIDAEAYRAEPLSLIAVVDRSGSMGGEPITRVKEGLHAIVDQMREGDRLGIVIYGSSTVVHQDVIDVENNKAALHAAIDGIAINGSTYMEAGMKLGFATAFEELEHSRGKTRLMLFTDENPNVGDTSAEGFMGQAIDGSRKGVGMTTIGVGAHFDGALATKVSSVRGGNLFFVPEEGAANELFATEFENMVGEVAQDLVISIDPADGLKVGAIYGVPGELIADAGSGTVTVTIGSAFLSSKGGGIFATLEGEGGVSELAEISVAYTDAVSQKREADADTVLVSSEGIPANLAKAELLVDQYVTTTRALARFHDKGDAKGASKLLAGLSKRIAASDFEGMESEVELVDGLAAKATKLAHLAGRTLPSDLYGDWKVVRHRGVEDISRGDLIEINDYGEFITERTRGRDKGEEIYQEFAINERQLHIEDTGLVFDYRVRGDRLTLRNRLDGTEIVMRRDTT